MLMITLVSPTYGPGQDVSVMEQQDGTDNKCKLGLFSPSNKLLLVACGFLCIYRACWFCLVSKCNTFYISVHLCIVYAAVDIILVANKKWERWQSERGSKGKHCRYLLLKQFGLFICQNCSS